MLDFLAKKTRFLGVIVYSRGELFFAKCWLIVEGETEQAFFEHLLNNDGFLDQKGIRIIQYAQLDLNLLFKLSNQLCIRWFLIADGDNEGIKYASKAKAALPSGHDEQSYIFQVSESTIEVNLMNNGFHEIYTSKLSQQTSKNITGDLGTLEYYESVYKAIHKSISKPQVVLEIVEAITNGSTPPPLLNIIRLKLEAIY